MAYLADIFYKPGWIQVFAVFALFVFLAKAQNTDEACVTPNNFTGTCIEVRKCPYMINRLKTPLTQSTIEDLRSFQCGFQGNQPFVCCPIEEENSAIQNTNLKNHPNIQLLQNKTCGQFFQSRIFNGLEANIWDYPWMALLGYENKNRTQYYCGGSIINERYILTAAHCLTEFSDDIKLSYVRVGEFNLNTEKDCDTAADNEDCQPPAEDYGIQETIPHPEFDKKNIKNDIGLIRLDRSINFSSERVETICLPLDQKSMNHTGKMMSIAGWGVTKAGYSSSVLLSGVVRVMATDICMEEYNKFMKIDSNTQLCTNEKYNKEGQCISDSGGPLMEGIPSGKAVQTGVFSFASEICRSERFPKVYTKVEPYLKWILDSLKP